MTKGQINTIYSHLYGEPIVVKFIYTESRMVYASGWGREKWGVICLMSTEIQFYKMKIVLMMDAGDGKSGYEGKFCYVYFTTTQNNKSKRMGILA